MRFSPFYPLKQLEPAAYNPRRISEEAFERLKESLARIGVVKPLILNGKLIAAGHQRARAAAEIGLKTVPVVILPEVSRQDEIMFNLFHNRVETGNSEVVVSGAAGLKDGYSLVRYHRLKYQENRHPVVVNEIAKLILRYGPFGSLVIDDEGQVLENSDYAVASSLLREDVLVYKVPAAHAGFLDCLRGDFGQYHYDHLAVKPASQHLCQMNRLGGIKRQNRSSVYENYVLPDLKKTDRLIDFGAGKCAYVNLLEDKGFRALAYGPHVMTSDGLVDEARVVGFIEDIEADVRKNGLFDVVVLDGVINSITSLDFERYVMTVCNALTRHDGRLCVGTRNLDFAKGREKREKSIRDARRRQLQFFDKHNFSATFRRGVWTMQRFHTPESLSRLLRRFYAAVDIYDYQRSDIWAVCRKPKRLPAKAVREALNIEFNMELSNGHFHNRHHGLVEAVVIETNRRSSAVRK